MSGNNNGQSSFDVKVTQESPYRVNLFQVDSTHWDELISLKQKLKNTGFALPKNIKGALYDVSMGSFGSFLIAIICELFSHQRSFALWIYGVGACVCIVVFAYSFSGRKTSYEDKLNDIKTNSDAVCDKIDIIQSIRINNKYSISPSTGVPFVSDSSK